MSTRSREGLGSPEPEGFPSEPGLYDAEALDADPLLHLGEVGVAGGPVPVAAYLSEVGVASEAFDEVLDVGYLLDLAEHQGLEVPLGVVLYGSPGAFGVEVCPEDGMDRS